MIIKHGANISIGCLSWEKGRVTGGHENKGRSSGLSRKKGHVIGGRVNANQSLQNPEGYTKTITVETQQLLQVQHTFVRYVGRYSIDLFLYIIAFSFFQSKRYVFKKIIYQFLTQKGSKIDINLFPKVRVFQP